MVRYLHPTTTPDRSDTHLYRAAQVLVELGEPAVLVISAAIQSAPPDGDLDGLLSPVWRMGPEAAGALPALEKVLHQKDRNAASVIVALQRIGDRASITAIRPFLRAGVFTTRMAAARALTKLGDQESFDAIAALIPNPITRNHISEAKELLNLLQNLDSTKAHPIATRVNADPAMSPVRVQIRSK